jgi:hypothetical protein
LSLKLMFLVTFSLHRKRTVHNRKARAVDNRGFQFGV